MQTQITTARQGETTPLMNEVAQAEGVTSEFIREQVAAGRVVILRNHRRGTRTIGVGAGLRTKVNASIGTSSDIVDLAAEVHKAQVAEEMGADTLMELSVGGDLDAIRHEVLAATSLPVGNVPLYQAFYESNQRYGDPAKLDPELLFDLIEEQCADGIAFMAIHCGINLYTLERLEKQGYRYGGLVSKGGSFMIKWMMANQRENPLYEQFPRVVEILKRYDTVLSLGNGLRAGAIADSMDRAQIQELVINCELAELGQKMGCQMMVEGPGHVPLDEIEANIILQKRMSNDAPYYMLGPIPTDITAGYDHIAAAIGAAYSSRYGADLICYITPAEHLALPDAEDVRQGIKAARVAAYTGDLVKRKAGRDRDLRMSRARRDMDWEGQFREALFPTDARSIRERRTPRDQRTCTMCGDFCAAMQAGEVFGKCLQKGVKK